MRRSWPNVDAYYADAPPKPGDRGGRSIREASPEVDYGVWWRETTDAAERIASPSWRVSFAVDAGEIYAVCLGAWVEYAGHVELLAVGVESRERAEEILAGWAEVCGSDGSLGWIRRRLAAAGVRP